MDFEVPQVTPAPPRASVRVRGRSGLDSAFGQRTSPLLSGGVFARQEGNTCVLQEHHNVPEYPFLADLNHIRHYPGQLPATRRQLAEFDVA